MATKPIRVKTYSETNLPSGIDAATLRAFAQADRLLKRYTAKRSTLRDKIIAAFGAGTHVFESVIVVRESALVTDTDALKEAYPFEKYPEYYKTTPTLDLKSVPTAIKHQYANPQEKVSVSA